jgi:DNA-binding CsgD family transcriptional regulator
VLCLHRQASPSGFTEGELALVRRLVPHLAEGVRRSAFAAGGRPSGGDGQPDPPGPGVLALAPGGDIVAISPEAEYWLAQLPAGDFADGPLPVGVLAAVAGSSAVRTWPAAAAPAVRLRTRAGEWLSVHVTTLPAPTGGTTADPTGGTTAVVIQPASPAQMTSLLLDAHGLTPAQQRVAALVLRGASTKDIVRELHISEYTVQEHLRAVFDKFGVGSRRALIAAVLTSA